MVRYHLIVHGRVQGVGFRYYVQEKAHLYGIRGWVKNRFDGTVEIEAEGEEENLRLFLESVRRTRSLMLRIGNTGWPAWRRICVTH